MMNEKQVNIVSLKGEYKALSKAMDYFPTKGSKHKAAIYIGKRMGEILTEIEELSRYDYKQYGK